MTPRDRRPARGRPARFQSAPLKRPEKELTPTSWSPRGEAIANVNDRKALLWQGIVGETALFRLQHSGQNQDYANWVGSRQRSPHRVKPPCERVDPCGGCPLMHMDAAGQATVRRSLLEAALAEAEVEQPPIDPMVTSPDGLLGFRNVVKLVAGPNDQGGLRVGAPGRNTRHVVPIPECPVLAPGLGRVAREMAYLAVELGLRPFVPEQGGLLRWLVARRSSTTGEVMVTVVAGKRIGLLNQYAEQLAERCSEVTGVHLHLNDGPGNAIFSPDGQGLVGTLPLVGGVTITEKLSGVELRVGPGDFYQTNPAVAERIAADLLELGGVEPGVPVVDLYCGVGGFTLTLAKRSGWALGVEGNEGAIQRARESARLAGITAEFIASPVEEALPRLARRMEGRRPLVVVNPARRGLEDGVIEGLAALNPRRLLYVSCNPKALAGDLARFVAEGWRVARLRPYDMFPNTAHQEVLAVIEPPETDEPVKAGRGPRRRVVR